MANYSLVSNAVFQPISYERYMQPILAYQQARDAQEEKYLAMMDDAAKYEALKDTIDNDSYLEYKKFKDLADEGIASITSGSIAPLDRQKLMQARKMYSQSIKPLNERYVKREKEAQLQYEAKLKNNNIQFSREARNTPLSAYSNGMPDIQVIDGDKVTALAAQIATPYAQTLLNDKLQLEKVLPYKYRDKIQYGLTPQELLLGLAESANGGDAKKRSLATQLISTLQQQVFESTGLSSWDEKARTKLTPWVMNRINLGLNNLVGKAAYDKWSDDYGKELALAIAKKQLEGADKTVGGPDYMSRNIYTQEELSKYKDAWGELKPYMYKDTNGTWHMNDAGRRKYANDMSYSSSEAYQKYLKETKAIGKQVSLEDYRKWLKSQEGRTPNSPGDFRLLVDSLGLQGVANNKLGPSQNKLVSTMFNAVNEQYDAKANSEHYRAVDTSQHDNVNRMLHSIADKNGEIDNYAYSKNADGKLVLSKKDKIKVKDIKASDIASVQTVVGKHGSYYEIKLIGKEDTIRIPVSKFSNSFKYVDEYKGIPIQEFIEAQNRGDEYVKAGGNVMSIQDALRGGISDYIDAATSIIGTTQVEPRKINQGIQ